MKVFIITDEPFPNGMAATSRIKCYARAIKKGGLDCEVLIFHRTERYGIHPKNTEGIGTFGEGIPFRFIGGTPLRSNNVLTRKFYDFLDIWRTEKYLRHNMQNGDVLFLYMGKNVKLMLRFMTVAHTKGAYCVRDLCELPYGTKVNDEKAIYQRKIIFDKQFPLLDGVVCISDTLLNIAKTYTLPKCKYIKIPILVDFEQFYLPNHSSEAEFPYIFHAGTLYEQKDGILGMVEAFGKASILLRKNVHFITTGNLDDSPHKNEINRLIKQYRLNEKLLFAGYLSDLELKDYLSKAAMVIINKYSTQQNNYCFSTKLGEYLAAAKPVIITNVGEAMNWLTDNKNAYIVEPEDTEELSKVIFHVFSNPDEANQIGIEGQKLCQRCFDYQVWSRPIVDFMIQLAK